MPFVLGSKSLARLNGVHPDLVKVVKAAIKLSEVDFTVLEGLRTQTRQRQLFAAGATKTLNSRHLTGHAVDLGALIGGTVRWDFPLYTVISKAMKQASRDLGIPITWGGDWRTFKDGPHYELPWSKYPA